MLEAKLVLFCFRRIKLPLILCAWRYLSVLWAHFDHSLISSMPSFLIRRDHVLWRMIITSLSSLPWLHQLQPRLIMLISLRSVIWSNVLLELLQRSSMRALRFSLCTHSVNILYTFLSSVLDTDTRFFKFWIISVFLNSCISWGDFWLLSGGSVWGGVETDFFKGFVDFGLGLVEWGVETCAVGFVWFYIFRGVFLLDDFKSGHHF